MDLADPLVLQALREPPTQEVILDALRQAIEEHVLVQQVAESELTPLLLSRTRPFLWSRATAPSNKCGTSPVAEHYLVDTSVFVRWYLQQDGYQDAIVLRAAFAAGAVDLQTVDFVRFELGHVLRTHGLLKDRLTEDEYVAAARSLDDAEIRVHVTSADMLEQAAILAARRMLRFYDALLISWSLELGLTVLTADEKLCAAIGSAARTQLLPGSSW